MVKHTQKIRRQQPTNCLSVFDHFLGLAVKQLTSMAMLRVSCRFLPVQLETLFEILESQNHIVKRLMNPEFCRSYISAFLNSNVLDKAVIS